MIGKEITEHTITKELTLNDKDIIKLLKQNHYIQYEVPNSDVSVSFGIPGGGDWSNTTIDISKAHPIKVSYSMIAKSPTSAY